MANAQHQRRPDGTSDQAGRNPAREHHAEREQGDRQRREAAAGASPAPPSRPGQKKREYPHSSGDRNTMPPRPRTDQGARAGGTQRVAPNDAPARRERQRPRRP